MLIGTLLFGQTFCCCTAKATALLESFSVQEAPKCCCCTDKGTCPDREHREDCPCKQKRQLADIGVPVNAEASLQLHPGLIALTAELFSEPAVEIVPLLASWNAHQEALRAIPRADRVALSQLLLI